MTDPAQPPTAFERACAAYWHTTSTQQWDYVGDRFPSTANDVRRGLAAALRELRDGGPRPGKPERIWLDAVLADSPDAGNS